MFGEVEYNPDGGYSSVPLEEQFNALVDAQKAGKILQFGLSNETAWGLMRFCEIGRDACTENDMIHLCFLCCHKAFVGRGAYRDQFAGL